MENPAPTTGDPLDHFLMIAQGQQICVATFKKSISSLGLDVFALFAILRLDAKLAFKPSRARILSCGSVATESRKVQMRYARG